MTLDEFNDLNEAEKVAIICAGRFLADRKENGLIVRLYSLDNFYLKVYVDAHVNRILWTRAFDNIKLLVPYLTHIKFNLY